MRDFQETPLNNSKNIQRRVMTKNPLATFTQAIENDVIRFGLSS